MRTRFWPALALAIALLACGTSSASPSTQHSLPSIPVASGGPSAEASSVATPGPIDRDSPTPAAQPTSTLVASTQPEQPAWIKFRSTKGIPVYGVHWSPDARYVLVQAGDPHGGFTALGTDLVDQTGRSIQWYPLLGFGSWLDDEHFILYSSNETRPGYDWTADNAWLADTKGSDPQQLQLPHGTDSADANGHGAAAINRFLGVRNGIERDDYYVWSNGLATERRDGFAINWSLDGTKLAVIHPFTPTRGTLGWPEVVAWPGLDTVWKENPPETQGSIDFDPSGKFIAYDREEDMPDGTSIFFTRIVTLATGNYVDVPATDRSSYFWASGHLNTIADGVLSSYDAAGKLISTRPAPAGFGEASADGSTVFYTDDYPASSVRVERSGDVETLEFPITGYYKPGWLSNDGRGVALEGSDGVYLTWLSAA